MTFYNVKQIKYYTRNLKITGLTLIYKQGPQKLNIHNE